MTNESQLPQRVEGPRMIRTLTVEGYRGLQQFTLDGLARVNLLVGSNNSGKTTVLEAIELLATRMDLDALWRTLQRRVEQFPKDPDEGSGYELDPCHLFYGHSLDPGIRFTLQATSAQVHSGVECSVVLMQQELGQAELFAKELPSDALGLLIRDIETGNAALHPLTKRGGLSERAVRFQRPPQPSELQGSRVRFISTESLSQQQAGFLWQAVALSPEEEYAVDAMRAIDDRIERVAYVGSTRVRNRGGFVAKVRGHVNPIPLGSMGDGVWRLLVLALAAASAQKGILLVDEIDTGLHHSVMEDMWRILARIAARHGVQVFCTTHSNDCVHALAAICRADSGRRPVASIQRLEHGEKKARSFTDQEIALVAERNIEIR